MTINGALQGKLGKWRFESGRQTLEHAEAGWKLELTADCADQIGSRCWEVTVTQAPLAADALKTRAERLASRITGLLETLRVVEVDMHRPTALLRSQAPARGTEGVAYYELVLDGTGRNQLRRYQGATAEAPRQQIGFTLTHEGLTKLVGDLVAE